MKGKFLKGFAIAVLGAGISALPWPVFAVETGTDTNQTANLYATNSITLRGSMIASWQDLTNSLDAFYIKNASTWSYYPAVSNVSLASKELTNVAAMTLGGERRTTWPSGGSGGEPTNWSYYVAVSNVNLSNKELTNVVAMTLGDQRRTNWPGQTITILAQGATLAWANQPVALTEFVALTIHRTQVDLSGYNQARLTVVTTVDGAADARIVAQYSTDQSTWSFLDGNNGPFVNINTPTGLKTSSWVNITGNAQQDVFIRIAGTNGNAVADPSFGLVTLQIK